MQPAAIFYEILTESESMKQRKTVRMQMKRSPQAPPIQFQIVHIWAPDADISLLSLLQILLSLLHHSDAIESHENNKLVNISCVGIKLLIVHKLLFAASTSNCSFCLSCCIKMYPNHTRKIDHQIDLLLFGQIFRFHEFGHKYNIRVAWEQRVWIYLQTFRRDKTKSIIILIRIRIQWIYTFLYIGHF